MANLEQLAEAKKHVLNISLVDFKAFTGRSLQDTQLELVVGHSEECDFQKDAVEGALLDLYSNMQKQGIPDAVALKIDASYNSEEAIYSASAFATGLRRIEQKNQRLSIGCWDVQETENHP